MSQLIYNAQIVNENEQFRGYVVIKDKFIEEVGVGNPTPELISRCSKSMDANGFMLLPGAIDDQVHFRDPGLTHKADIATESAAAVAGGVTSFMDMPNTIPQTTTTEALEDKKRHASEVSLANYGFYLGATNTNLNILLKADYGEICGVKLFLGASTGNMLVDNKEALKNIFSEVPTLIAIHSESEEIIKRNKIFYQNKFGSDLPIFFHPLIRSEEACYACTANAVELAEKYGTQLHILHLSTAKELSFLSNDKPLVEKKITGEVCVHHLWFTDNDYAALGNKIKWNPAIKTFADRAALREALNDNRLDIVATDHAPHLLSEKMGNCFEAASGGPLIQFSLIAMLEMARKGIFSIEKVVDKMCHAPAILYKIDRRGYLRKGYYADMVLVNHNAENKVVSENILSRCKWSPFEGYRFHSKIIATFVNGNLVYENGSLDTHFKGLPLKFLR